MDNKDQKNEDQPVDEEFIMSIMAGGVRKPGQIPPPKEPDIEKPILREKNRNKKTSDTSYQDRFLNSHTMTRRGDKSIYIRQEYHERLSRIVQVIGEDKIPLYAYLDNILEHHFELFEKTITEDFNNKYKPIF
ncbi:DUF3408 domain-containing protein [Flavobacterium sp. Arc3]|uniref:DUF3408 domain-containing protein n=1 Tax=Flavobacterium sp. Arc3 TaxID=3046686 RepID=UPI00352EE701